MSQTIDPQGPRKRRPKKQLGQWSRLLLEIGPLVVFFLANSQTHRFLGTPYEQNLFYATGFFMVATAISLGVSYALTRHIPTMPLVTGVFVMLFGGLTIYLQDELFIKIKPTLVNGLFAAALLGGLAFGQHYLKLLFDGMFHLTDTGWRRLTLNWGLFFVFLAVVNEIVWRNFSTEFWAGFKLFGIMPITMVFAMTQVGVLMRYHVDPPPEDDEDTDEVPRD